ncbi:(deoxy)nucleoside triphosphate pyrophosphohydrolase [uncultured Psychroserpens sp.]|uniref:(deoxy)nucleoside triphosphate pyrophosphohydrolase n=1 Tax=uncultured Psychroserpens sp. TaxID=255436 RepID=UPI002612031C|nr:(deoxy)nucleoside triphosphate pyrophosphohydrolase [uncultured Psychroserpens sp.]
MIKVACGIIYRDDKLFLCRRNPNKHLGGYWEFPGGKLEFNEFPEDALKRELEEELSMSVEIKNHFTTVIHKYENFVIELIAYECKFIKADYLLNAHDKYEWLELNEIKNIKLSPADIPILDKLTNVLNR